MDENDTVEEQMAEKDKIQDNEQDNENFETTENSGGSMTEADGNNDLNSNEEEVSGTVNEGNEEIVQEKEVESENVETVETVGNSETVDEEHVAVNPDKVNQISEKIEEAGSEGDIETENPVDEDNEMEEEENDIEKDNEIQTSEKDTEDNQNEKEEYLENENTEGNNEGESGTHEPIEEEEEEEEVIMKIIENENVEGKNENEDKEECIEDENISENMNYEQEQEQMQEQEHHQEEQEEEEIVDENGDKLVVEEEVKEEDETEQIEEIKTGDELDERDEESPLEHGMEDAEVAAVSDLYEEQNDDDGHDKPEEHSEEEAVVVEKQKLDKEEDEELIQNENEDTNKDQTFRPRSVRLPARDIQVCDAEIQTDNIDTVIECKLPQKKTEESIEEEDVTANFEAGFKDVFSQYATPVSSEVPLAERRVTFSCFLRFCRDFGVFSGVLGRDELARAFKAAGSDITRLNLKQFGAALKAVAKLILSKSECEVPTAEGVLARLMLGSQQSKQRTMILLRARKGEDTAFSLNLLAPRQKPVSPVLQDYEGRRRSLVASISKSHEIMAVQGQRKKQSPRTLKASPNSKHQHHQQQQQQQQLQMAMFPQQQYMMMPQYPGGGGTQPYMMMNPQQQQQHMQQMRQMQQQQQQQYGYYPPQAQQQQPFMASYFQQQQQVAHQHAKNSKTKAPVQPPVSSRSQNQKPRHGQQHRVLMSHQPQQQQQHHHPHQPTMPSPSHSNYRQNGQKQPSHYESPSKSSPARTRAQMTNQSSPGDPAAVQERRMQKYIQNTRQRANHVSETESKNQLQRENEILRQVEAKTDPHRNEGRHRRNRSQRRAM
eukprot:TRINITY_DN461_c0_g1_i4.p1 TRINITY_DN461_c0_g1~~TRINITY_DN461_c0_g1_i4.p1  ORF type:complete len:831 (-),score=347.30 TRINITY_DN461_c0_g1_i4:108-2600(-)